MPQGSVHESERMPPASKSRRIVELAVKYEGNFIRYIFDTDDGEVAVICGAVVDKVLANTEACDQIYAITFGGKQEGKEGQKFNMFDVERMLTKD